MLRHIVSWNYQENISQATRRDLNNYFTDAFSQLKEKIPGVLSVVVAAPPMASSTKDLCLYAEFSDEEALKNYASHPEHQKIVKVIQENCQDRCCVDF